MFSNHIGPCYVRHAKERQKYNIRNPNKFIPPFTSKLYVKTTFFLECY